MNPIAFKIQLDGTNEKLNENIDFNLFKIDFMNLLGCGLYGQVYPIIKRPSNEQNWFARRFTILHDLLHLNTTPVEETDYCVKLFKPIPYVLARITYFTARNYLSKPGKLAKDSFFVKTQEVRSHKLLERYGLTSIKFYDGGGYWGQVKSRVIGKTLEDYCRTGEFIAKDSFQLRLQLYHFFLNLNTSPLTYDDIHALNIMFSIKEREWFIVDGAVEEIPDTQISQKEKNKQVQKVATYLSKTLGLIEKRLTLAIAKMAIAREPYSEKTDSLLLQNTSRCVDDTLIKDKHCVLIWRFNKSTSEQKLSNSTYCIAEI